MGKTDRKSHYTHVFGNSVPGPYVRMYVRFAAARRGLALRTGGCVEKFIKRESRVIVANGRTGGDREVPKQPAR